MGGGGRHQVRVSARLPEPTCPRADRRGRARRRCRHDVHGEMPTTRLSGPVAMDAGGHVQAVRLHATPHALRTHRFVVAPRQSCNFSQSAAFDATHYCGVLAVTSTSMSIPGHASAVTTRNVPAGWVAPAYASARHLPASRNGEYRSRR